MVVGRREVLEARGHRGCRRPRRRGRLLAELAKGGQAPGPRTGVGEGDRGTGRLLTGLALVRDPEAAAVIWIPSDLLRRRQRAVPSSALLFGGQGRRWPPTAPSSSWGSDRAGLELLQNLRLDTMLASYLLDPAEARYRIEELLPRYTPFEYPGEDTKAEGQLALEEDAVPRLRRRRPSSAGDRPPGRVPGRRHAGAGVRELHDDIEVPLVRVLARMEEVGVAVDRKVLPSCTTACCRVRGPAPRRSREDAGEDFVVNSTKQLREILFDKLGLTPQKKTKTGFSTDAASLEKLAGEHPIIDHLLRYREVEKLRSTYGERCWPRCGRRPDPRHLQPDRRPHRPPQQRPAQPAQHPGAHRRGAGIPAGVRTGEGLRALVADYNQIELRCIAHLAEDSGSSPRSTERTGHPHGHRVPLFKVGPGT